MPAIIRFLGYNPLSAAELLRPSNQSSTPRHGGHPVAMVPGIIQADPDERVQRDQGAPCVVLSVRILGDPA